MYRIALLVALAASLAVAPPAVAEPELTVEAGVGVGGLTQIYTNPVENTLSWDSVRTASGALGAGAFVTPDLAVTARFTAARWSLHDHPAKTLFVGADAQYWLADRIWLAGGLGLVVNDPAGESDEDTLHHDGNAPGVDLRAGLVAWRTHRLDVAVSLAYTAGLYTTRYSGDRTALVGILVLGAGVQFR